MRYIIVDTSSIIFGLSNKADVFNSIKITDPEYEPLISLGVLSELNRISDAKGRFSKFAAAGVYLIEEHRPDIANSKDAVDTWIEQEAVKRRCDVCTNDVKLKKRLKSLGITVFSISRDGTIR